MRRTVILLALAACFGARAASADDAGRLGIAMGYPTSVGVLWEVSDRLAVRPDLSFVHVSSDLTTTTSLPGTTVATTTTNEGTQVTAGIAALVYVAKHDALRTYVSPRVAYTRSSSSFQGSSGAGFNAVSDTTNTAYLVSGSVGAQYALGTRFGVIGELGLQYQRTNPSAAGSGTFTIATQRSSTLGIRSGAGVILYFH